MTSSSRIRSRYKVNRPSDDLDVYMTRQIDAVDQQGVSTPQYDTSSVQVSRSPYQSRIDRKEKETQIVTAPCCKNSRLGHALPPDISPSPTMGQSVTVEFEEFCNAFYSSSESPVRVVNPMRQLLQEAAMQTAARSPQRASRRWSEVPADKAKVYMARRFADKQRTDDEGSDKSRSGASPAAAASLATTQGFTDSSRGEERPHSTPGTKSPHRRHSERPPASPPEIGPESPSRSKRHSEPAPSAAESSDSTPQPPSPARKKPSRSKSNQSLRAHHSKSPSRSKAKSGSKSK